VERAEKLWLTISASLGAAGLALLAVSNPNRWCDPVFYIGCAVAALAVYFAVAVFVPRLPLPTLPSERAAAKFQKEIDEFLLVGQKLFPRPVTSDEDLAALIRDHDKWMDQVGQWLRREVSPAAADAFVFPHGDPVHLYQGYNKETDHRRQEIKWQIEILRKLAPDRRR
jgi:hypothetical protein